MNEKKKQIQGILHNCYNYAKETPFMLQNWPVFWRTATIKYAFHEW